MDLHAVLPISTRSWNTVSNSKSMSLVNSKLAHQLFIWCDSIISLFYLPPFNITLSTLSNHGLCSTRLLLLEFHSTLKENSFPCIGCHKGGLPKKSKHHICLFQEKIFSLGSFTFTPCIVCYHYKLIMAGSLFKERYRQKKDIQHHPRVLYHIQETSGW